MALIARKFITQDAFDNAQHKFGHIEISVTNTPVSIKGILKENFSISTEANYDNIFSVSDKLEGARKVFDFALGATFLNTGQWTRKYYKGGSYMKITPKFRVVDYDGTSEPLRAAFILLNSALPTPGKHDRFLDEMKGMNFEDIERKIGIISEPDAVSGQNFDSTTYNIKRNISNAGAIAKGIWSLLSGQLGNSPNPVSVKVSNFFSWDEMVVDSVNVEFSKEMIAYNDSSGSSGPLYVDIDVVMSSREVATIGRTGLEKFDKRFVVVPGNSDSAPS